MASHLQRNTRGLSGFVGTSQRLVPATWFFALFQIQPGTAEFLPRASSHSDGLQPNSGGFHSDRDGLHLSFLQCLAHRWMVQAHASLQPCHVCIVCPDLVACRRRCAVPRYLREFKLPKNIHATTSAEVRTLVEEVKRSAARAGTGN